MRGNQQIENANRRPCGFEPGTDLTEQTGGCRREIKDRQGRQELV